MGTKADKTCTNRCPCQHSLEAYYLDTFQFLHLQKFSLYISVTFKPYQQSMHIKEQSCQISSWNSPPFTSSGMQNGFSVLVSFFAKTTVLFGIVRPVVLNI